MTDDKTEIEKSQSQMSRMIAIVASSIYAIFGFYVYGMNIGYYEDGQSWVLFLFILAGAGFVVGVFRGIVPVIILTSLIAIVCLTFSVKSFNWRKEYMNNGFILAEYINDYPSYFETFKGRVFGGPRLVEFANECLGTERRPVSRDRVPPRECSSIAAMNQAFGLDIFNILNQHYLKMRRTAEAISEDRAADINYPACVNTRRCAFVELLPPEMPEDQIQDSTDPNIIRVRDGFWELLDLNYITPNICQGMVLCRRLAELEIMDHDQLVGLRAFQEDKNRNLPTAKKP